MSTLLPHAPQVKELLGAERPTSPSERLLRHGTSVEAILRIADRLLAEMHSADHDDRTFYFASGKGTPKDLDEAVGVFARVNAHADLLNERLRGAHDLPPGVAFDLLYRKYVGGEDAFREGWRQ